MDEVSFNVNIPLDEDGFIEMECDYCKNRFMLHKNTYEDDNNLNFFCPICGLPNSINSFFCPEVIERFQQEAISYMQNELQRQLGGSIKAINRSGFAKITMKHSDIGDKQLYAPINQYEIEHKFCCGIDVKIHNIDKQIGTYCPICGGENL